MPRIDNIQLRAGTAAQWTAANPTLLLAEPGLETDTLKIKYGDGSTPWSALPYASVDMTSKLNASNTVYTNSGSYTMSAAELAALNAGASLVSQGNNTGTYEVPDNATLAIPVGKSWAVRGYSAVVNGGSMVVTGTRGDLTIPSGMTVVIEKTGTNTAILHNGSSAGGATYYGQTTGVNSYAVALTPTLGALATGVVIKVKFKDASTAAATLNADTLGAKKLYKNPTTQVGNGDITDEQIYDMTYDAALDGGAGGWLIDGLAGGGSVAFATASEVNTGVEAAKAIAPDQLAASKYLMRRGSKTYAASTTAANTYTGGFTPAIAAADLGAGIEIRVLFTNHNTGAATFNADGTGALAIVNVDGSALRAYQIADGHLAILVHNGTSWVLTNPASRRSVVGNSVVLNNSAGTNYLVLASPGSGTTLNCKDLEEIKFDGPAVGSIIANNFTVNPANDGQLQYGGFIAAINSGIVITFPSSFVMASTEWRWNAGARTFTTAVAGYFEFQWSRTIDGKFMLKVTDSYPTS